jgi:hypothetical protein
MMICNTYSFTLDRPRWRVFIATIWIQVLASLESETVR